MKSTQKRLLKIIFFIQVIMFVLLLSSPILFVLYTWQTSLKVLLTGLLGLVIIKIIRKKIYKSKSVFDDLYVSQWGEFDLYQPGKCGIITGTGFNDVKRLTITSCRICKKVLKIKPPGVLVDEYIICDLCASKNKIN